MTELADIESKSQEVFELFDIAKEQLTEIFLGGIESISVDAYSNLHDLKGKLANLNLTLTADLLGKFLDIIQVIKKIAAHIAISASCSFTCLIIVPRKKVPRSPP